jgi:SAM-dependent methyltransferase
MMPFAERLFLIAKFQVLTRVLLARKRILARLFPARENARLMVNIGGGLFFRPYWKVLDHVSPYYPFQRAYIDYDVDLMTGAPFPFADNSIDFFYSAHTLEHIPQENCPALLREIYRALKPGGAVRLNMPDYDRMRRAAAAGNHGYFIAAMGRNLTIEQAVVEQIATDMLDCATAEEIARDYAALSPEDFADRYTSRASRDVQKRKGGYHINWFNYDKLARLLREAGFSDVVRSEPQGSRFSELRGEGGYLTTGDAFELKRMLGLDTTYPDKSLYVEAVK